jgi:hypothetical protein
MRLIPGTLTAAALIAAASASPVLAQAVGMAIVDSSGAPVGTVTALRGDNVEVKTDKHAALLPKSSFTLANGKLLFGMTQAQLNSQIEASAAASKASIAAGAMAKGVNGTDVGKVDTVENGQVTITLTSGKRLQLPISGVRGNADGTVTVGYTAEQIEALVSASTSGATAGQ